MDHPEICENEQCERKATVGVGSNPVRWLCIECFNAEMSKTKAIVDRLRGLR